MVGKVKLVSGLLSADRNILSKAKEVLQRCFGSIDLESPMIPFDFTEYYDEELGKGIIRQWVSFERLIHPEHIGRVKRRTIKIEKRFMVGGNRKVNIDPGFISLDKLVLATTKDATYRIYLGKGIYAQPTLFFQKGGFHPWQWTYPDYRTDVAIEFFNKVRGMYKGAMLKGILKGKRSFPLKPHVASCIGKGRHPVPLFSAGRGQCGGNRGFPPLIGGNGHIQIIGQMLR